MSKFDKNFRRCSGISSTAHQINEEIRDKEIRLIGDDGSQLGIMSAQEALDYGIVDSIIPHKKA